MLQCSIHDARAGMVLGAQVNDPRHPERRLLLTGVTLDSGMIASLVKRGVSLVWVEDDLTSDLDASVAPQLEGAKLEVYSRLREDLSSLSRQTITTASAQMYRQAVMDLVTQAISAGAYVGLTGSLMACDGLATHGANVAYLSLLCGLHSENYIISEQKRLEREQARDMAVLGMAGLLHDIGKVRLDPKERASHEVNREVEAPDAGYAGHLLNGRELLEHARAPARVSYAVLNHHQRHDGRGWPDMGPLTAGRITGPLRGKQIHVFARIVAAANVLDNLLSAATRAGEPPVSALRAFASSRFDGWFDPMIRRSMLLRVPPFGVGTEVRLSDGRRAVVAAPTPRDPCRPQVRALTAENGKRLNAAETIDLTERRDVQITHHMGREVGDCVYEPPPLPSADVPPEAQEASPKNEKEGDPCRAAA